MLKDQPGGAGRCIWRTIFVVFGLVCVGLAVLGLILPLLPTTPFLLLAGYLFARSSERWHRWLVSHKQLGPYIHGFRSDAGLTAPQKFRIGASFSVLFAVSIYFVPGPTIKTLLVLWWLYWILFICRVKTAAAPVDESECVGDRGQ